MDLKVGLTCLSDSLTCLSDSHYLIPLVMPMKNGYSIGHAQGSMHISLGVLEAWHTTTSSISGLGTLPSTTCLHWTMLIFLKIYTCKYFLIRYFLDKNILIKTWLIMAGTKPRDKISWQILITLWYLTTIVSPMISL
jgi:hypothetical protein